VRLGWPQGPAGAGFGPVGGGRPAPEAGTHARPRAPSAISARLGRSSDLRSAARVASGSCRWVGAGFVLQHRVRHRTRQQTRRVPRTTLRLGPTAASTFESDTRGWGRRWLGPRHVVTVSRDLLPWRHSGSPGGADSPPVGSIPVVSPCLSLFNYSNPPGGGCRCIRKPVRPVGASSRPSARPASTCRGRRPLTQIGPWRRRAGGLERRCAGTAPPTGSTAWAR